MVKQAETLRLVKRSCKISASALAMQNVPHLFPRHDGFGGAGQEGNITAFREYLQENRSELEAQASSRRAAARAAMQALTPDGTLPMTNKQWLSWLEENEAVRRAALRTSHTARKCVSRRLKPSDVHADMNVVARLSPCKEKLSSPTWVKKLLQEKHGFFVLGERPAQCVFFFCGLLGHGYAFQVRGAGHMEYELALDSVFRNGLTPALAAVQEWVGDVADDADVHRLEIGYGMLLSAKALRFRVLGIDRIALQSRKKQRKQDEASDPEFQDAADLQAEAGLDEGSDSQESLASDAETDAVLEAEEAACLLPEDCPAGETDGGTNVVAEYSNGYFSLEDYVRRRKGDHVKIRLRPRWGCALPEGLGRSEMSKSVTVRDYDCNPDSPQITYLLLRAWALGRSNRPAWLAHIPERRRWWDAELLDLQRDISRLGAPAGTTGCARADALIRSWAPQALQRAG